MTTPEHERLFAHWVERLRREETDAVAILCHGSYARGDAAAHSDLDLDVLVRGAHPGAYRSAFEELPDGRLLHATIETQALSAWLEQFDPPTESEDWAFFLPARQVARILWATPAARRRLEQRVTIQLALTPQLQDLLECAAKVRNAFADGDDLGVRLAAHDLTIRCPALLAPFNPPITVDNRRAALEAALNLPVAPPGYRQAMLVCLGMSGTATTMEQVHAAALQLADGILTRLAAQPGLITDLIEPGLPEALVDGRLVRLLTQ